MHTLTAPELLAVISALDSMLASYRQPMGSLECLDVDTDEHVGLMRSAGMKMAMMVDDLDAKRGS